MNDSPFNGLRVRIDPWEVEYGSELPPAAATEEESADIDAGIELPIDGWAPIVPATGCPRPSRLLFVDGIRRLETRLLVNRGDRRCHGALGSYGVGAVCVAGGRASWHTEHVGRIAVLGSGERFSAPLRLGDALEYEPRSTPSEEPDGPLLELHQEMRQAEERLARTLADADDTLVVVDGPITFGDATRGRAIGFIKRLFRLYLPEQQMAVVAALAAGQRSPIFAIAGAGRFSRLSWFVRLSPPLATDADLTGLVRLEVAASIGLAEAQRLADASAALLPGFVPGRARDPRAPQNLLPIGALEAHLRRRLGDARLVRRRLTSLIAREPARA